MNTRPTIDAETLRQYHATDRRIATWSALMDATFGDGSPEQIERLSAAYDRAAAAEREAR